MIEEPDGYMYTWEIVAWAQANLNIIKPKEALTNTKIREIMHWIGMHSVDTIFAGGVPGLLHEV